MFGFEILKERLWVDIYHPSILGYILCTYGIYVLYFMYRYIGTYIPHGNMVYATKPKPYTKNYINPSIFITRCYKMLRFQVHILVYIPIWMVLGT